MQPRAPAALNVPGGQDTHDAELVEAVLGLYEPALHRMQVAEIAPLYEPGAQGVSRIDP